MKDPYILESGVLKNKLGISDYDELNNAEADIGYTKLIDLESLMKETCDSDLIRKIHKHIFEDIFDWAGEHRVVPLYKEEVVLPGLSLEYSAPNSIAEDLDDRIAELNAYDWKDKNIDEIAAKFARILAKIWRVHPFRDGNTRSTLVFANIFAKQNGFELDMSTMIDHLRRIEDPKTGEIVRHSLRDKFVLASLDDKDYPEPEHLELIIKQSIINGKNQPTTQVKKGEDR